MPLPSYEELTGAAPASKTPSYEELTAEPTKAATPSYEELTKPKKTPQELADDPDFNEAAHLAQNPDDVATAEEVAWLKANKPATVSGAIAATGKAIKGAAQAAPEAVRQIVSGTYTGAKNVIQNVGAAIQGKDETDPEVARRMRENAAGVALGTTGAMKMAESAFEKAKDITKAVPALTPAMALLNLGKPTGKTREEVIDHLHRQAAYLREMQQQGKGELPEGMTDAPMPTFKTDAERAQFEQNIADISEAYGDPTNIPIVGQVLAPGAIASKVAGTGLKGLGKAGEVIGGKVAAGAEKLAKSKAAKIATPLGKGAAALDILTTGGAHTIPAVGAMAAGAGTWAGAKAAEALGRMTKEAGQELLGAAPGRGQSFYRKAIKEGIKGTAVGAVSGVPMMAGAETPEEMGAMVGGAAGLGGTVGTLSGLKNGRKIESAAQAAAMIENGRSVNYGDADDQAHAAVMQNLSPEAQNIVNFWRGHFDGATTPEGNAIRVEAVDNETFIRRAKQESRGVYFDNGTLLVNVGETVNGKFVPKTPDQIAGTFAHEGKHALDQALEASQPELYKKVFKSLKDRFAPNGTPTKEFQQWIDGQKKLIGDNMREAKRSEQEIAAALATYDTDYFLNEASADIGQGLVTGEDLGGFLLPQGLVSKVWDALKDATGFIPSPGDAATGELDLPSAQAAARQIRKQLYAQGAEARARMEAKEAGAKKGNTVKAKIAELTPIAEKPITEDTDLEERDAILKARKDLADLYRDIGQPGPTQTGAAGTPATGAAPVRDPAVVRAKADAMKALNTPPIKGLVPRDEQVQRIEEAIKQAEAQGIPITASELVTFATTRDFSEAARKAAPPPPSPHATITAQTLANRRTADAKSLSDSLEAHSVATHGFNGLDGPSRAEVLSAMLRTRHNPEIFDAIISAIPIDVVDNLRASQLSPEMPLHDHTVLKQLFTVDGNSPIALPIDAADRAIKSIAAMAAMLSSVSGGSRNNESGAALRAGQLHENGITKTDNNTSVEIGRKYRDEHGFEYEIKGESPDAARIGDIIVDDTGKPFRITKIWPDGSADVAYTTSPLTSRSVKTLKPGTFKRVDVEPATTTAPTNVQPTTPPTGEPVPTSVPAGDAQQPTPTPTTTQAEGSQPANVPDGQAATLSVIPYGNSGRFVIVDAAGNPINNRTYASENSAAAAIRQMGKATSFDIPPSSSGNDIIDAIIEQGGINLSGLIPEERNNVFPHKGVWRNVLTTDNPDMTPDEVARILESEGHGDGDMRTMFDLITEAIQARKSLAEQTRAEEQRQKSESRRATAEETQRVTDLANAAKAAATAAEKNPRTQAAQDRIRNAIIDALLADIGDDTVGLHKTTDEDGKEVIQGEFYPDDPRHQAIAALDGLTQRDAAQIQQMQAQNGKPTHIRYRGAKSEGEGADTGMDTRREEYIKDPAAERTAGTIHHKAVIPLFTYVTKDGRLSQKFITLNNLLHNMASIFEGLPLIGKTNPYGATALEQEPVIIQDANTYAENHRNGWKGDGSAPMNRFPDSGLPDPTPGYVPKIIPSDRFAILNMAFANETSAKLGERTADVQKRQAQLDEAKTPAERKKAENILKNAIRRMRKSEESFGLSEANVPWVDYTTGDPNKLRAELKAAGFDVNKRLKNPFENLSPKHILEVSDTPIDLQPGDIPSVRPPGFDIDPATLAKEGLPIQKAIGAAFMPAGSAGAKDKTEALGQQQGSFMPSKPEEKTPQQRAQERKTGRIINGAKEQAAIDLDPVFTANFMPQKRTDPSTISREEFLNSETYHQAIADFYKQRGALLQTYTEPYRTLIHGNFDTKEQAAKYLESERTSLDGKKEWENYILANEPEQQKDGKWGIYSTHEKIRRAPTPGASSKTIPFESPIELKPGMWRISPWKGAYGTEIEELVSIDPKKLSPSETMVLSNEEGRGDDSRRYEEWSKEGKTPPPIEVVQTDKGTLKVVDGHRRYFAALRANRPVLAWVSWSMDHPQGSRAYASDGNGPIIRVGLTKEAVDKHGLEKLNVNSEADYDDSGNIHFMPSKERDRAYLAAAESGDEATAQRLVDEAAQAAGYVFERGESEYSDDYLETADGEAGRGVYAYVPSEKMRSYYTAKGENIVAIKPRGRVIDLTDAKEKKGILAQAKRQGINANEGNYYKQPFAVQAHMMQEHPDAAGYIVPHSGYGIPSGKQVIFKEDMIDHVSADPITRDDTGRIIPLSERFNPATGDIRYMPAKAEEKRPDFYSRLEQNIQGTDMGDTKPQPGWKWAAVIRKLAKGASIPTKRNTMQTGIAAEELKWSGILPWLGEQKTVTKAQVLDYLAKDGALQVQEVKLAEGAHEGTFSEEGEDGRWHVYGEMANEGDVYDTPEEARAKAEEYNSTLPKGPPKFSQYQLPGGENYREVVLTMPTDKMAPGFKVFASENGTYGVEFPDGRRLDGWRTPEGARESQRKQEGSPVFTSTHFPDTGNYIAHARMNERTDAEGKPGLFLEELQSDRGQKIRQEEIADKKAIDEKWVEAITRLKKDGRLRVVCP